MIRFKSKWPVFACCLLFSVSCNSDEDCDPAPYDCIEYKPEEGNLIIEVTLDNLNSAVPVVIYHGDIEDEQVVLVDTIDTDTGESWLANDDYSVTAEYRLLKNSQEMTVYVVEGGNLDATSTEYCEGDCYEEGVLTLDVTLDPYLF